LRLPDIASLLTSYGQISLVDIYFRELLAEAPSTRLRLREGLGLPDSQAGHFRKSKLGILFCADEEQYDSANQCEPAERWRNGDSVVFFGGGMDRADIKDFLLTGVIESLVGKRQSAQHD
jgi:hypothetical protein